jgi:dCTP diphosphatase
VLDEEVRALALAFRSERDWEQFHTPANIAIALAVEAGELLAHFQWSSAASSALEGKKREAIEEEVADLAILLTYFAHDLNIDLNKVVRRKLALNAERYPVALAKGSAKKYTELGGT